VWREHCRSDGVAIARRSSGGGTVVIGPGALNFAVTLARDADPRLEAVDSAQRLVLERVAEALRTLEPGVELKGSGDLTVAGRKFSGSAQRRLKRHLLVHASLLYDFPLGRISRYLREPKRQPVYREGRSHAEFVTNLGLSRGRIVEAIRATWVGETGGFDEVAVPWGRVAELVADRYGDRDWVERF